MIEILILIGYEHAPTNNKYVFYKECFDFELKKSEFEKVTTKTLLKNTSY